jgi:hypothetical protein
VREWGGAAETLKKLFRRAKSSYGKAAEDSRSPKAGANFDALDYRSI